MYMIIVMMIIIMIKIIYIHMSISMREVSAKRSQKNSCATAAVFQRKMCLCPMQPDLLVPELMLTLFSCMKQCWFISYISLTAPWYYDA